MPVESSDAHFLTTRWSLIQRASGRGEESAAGAVGQALEELCASYWYPLYAFARRQGQAAADAQDAVQAFLLDLLERDGIARARADRGRFRNFLLSSFRNFQSKQRERASAQKRGGGKPVLSFAAEEAEQRYGSGSPAQVTPEQQFLRDWTMDLLAKARVDLANDYQARGQSALFAALGEYLAEGEAPDYPALAEALEMSVGSVRVALHRLRGRYRKAVRAAIADTLGEPSEEEVEKELSELLAALSAGGL